MAFGMSAQSQRPSRISLADGLITAMLSQFKRDPLSDPAALRQWQHLQKHQPRIVHFITAYSYQAAPEDPETRARIATGMLHLYVLLEKAQLQSEIGKLFGGTLAEHFKDGSTAPNKVVGN